MLVLTLLGIMESLSGYGLRLVAMKDDITIVSLLYGKLR
jgi:hypothetical protein